nr:LytR C-terminal domain-containing protein [Microbacterium pseudoresistens]
MNGWIVLLWSFVAALVLIVGGIFGAMVAMGKITLGPDAVATAPAPSPTETGTIDTSYAVLVLNATAGDGLAAGMRDTVVNAGWPAESVLPGNADVTDFPETIVYYQSDEDRAAALGLAEVIGGAKIAQSDVYANDVSDGQKQLTIVIGMDRAPVPEAPADGGTDGSTDDSGDGSAQ